MTELIVHKQTPFHERFGMTSNVLPIVARIEAVAIKITNPVSPTTSDFRVKYFLMS